MPKILNTKYYILYTIAAGTAILIIIFLIQYQYITAADLPGGGFATEFSGERNFPPGSQCPHRDYNNQDAHNITGWMWSENIGWVSLNCLNDHNPSADGIQPSLYNYGVNINWTQGQPLGTLSGWAWSPNIGWISFDRNITGNPPREPFLNTGDYIASIDKFNGSIQGWARAIAGNNSNNGGWNGWIRLSVAKTETTPNLTISKEATSELDKDKCQLRGWAWGEEVVGWLSLNCNQTAFGSTNNCATGGVSDPKSDYAFTITPSNVYSSGDGRFFCGKPPVVSNLSLFEANYCQDPDWRITFDWNYTDPDGEAQNSAKVRIYSSTTESSFKKEYLIDNASVRLISGTSSSGTYRGAATIKKTDGFNYNTPYYFKIVATDNSLSESDYLSQTPGTFTTPLHSYPNPNFTWLPPRPLLNEEITFTNTTPSSESPSVKFDWNWGDGTQSLNVAQDPPLKHTYTGVCDPSTRGCKVTLTAKPSDLPQPHCSIQRNIPISPRPGYKYEQTPQ